jgi:long-chain fatty acid transport protein
VNNFKATIGILVFLMIFSTSTINAGGFQVNEHSARATAMGGAVFANLNDASAIYFNPGALAYVPGTNLVFGSTFIIPSTTFTGPSPLTLETDSKSRVNFPSVFYGSHRLDNGLTLGLGFFNPYGLGTEWPEDWMGAPLGIKSALRTYFFNPTVSYVIGDILGVGAGFNYIYSTVELTQQLANPLDGQPIPGSRAELDGSGTGIGWNAGLYLNLDPNINIGVAYRSAAEVDFDGDAVMTVPAPLQPLLPGGDVTTSVKLPANLYVGLSFFGIEDLSINFGYQYIFWSSVEEIMIDFETKTQVQDTQTLTFNYDDGYIIRFGLEYNANSDLDLRLGYLYDSNPTQDRHMTPRLPDSDRHGITLGAGYRLTNSLAIDLSYMYLHFVERDITDHEFNFNGTYNTVAHLLGINFKVAI